MRRIHLLVTAACAALAAASAAPAQDSLPPAHRDTSPGSSWHLDLAVDHTGLGIGNSPEINGVRLNYRDAGTVTVRGLNATVWFPYRDVHSTVTGIALGVP